jgi:single-stranded-DNA-specific exonuclease
MAGRAARTFNVLSIAVSFNSEICTGSIRSARNYNVHVIFERCQDLFIDAGGHKVAGGFSLKMNDWETFLDRLEEIANAMEYDEEEIEESIYIDAELPPDFLSPEILKTIKLFEPYGNENEQIIFLAKNLIVKEIIFIGKPESKHLKLILDTGKYKWTALFWGNADRAHNKEFEVNDKIDIVFNITSDYFRGNEIPQLILLDLKKVK